MTKRITSLDVARQAGVSQSTVSRVFSTNSPNVSAKARAKVLQAAAELGYQPNAIARMMSTNRTNIIGIVMANITSPFYPYVLEKFLQRLQAIERQTLLFTASENQSVDDILPLALSYQVDGLIITSATLSSDMAEQCAQSGTPVILFNRTVQNTTVSAVCADNFAGARLIADVLLDAGHERLAFIAGTPNTSTSQEREKGFFGRLRERGYTKRQYAHGDYTYESGYEAAKELLSHRNPPDAIFCASDIMAIGALDAIREHGLLIPDDVSVIGFDDLPMSSWGAYQLTTVRQDVDIMIDKAIELLLERIDNPQAPAKIERVTGQLIIRRSTRTSEDTP